MIFGWRVRCDRPLPLLAPWNGEDGALAITIIFDDIPARLAPTVYANDLVDLWADGSVLIRPKNGPRILIEGGDRMIVEAGAQSDAEMHTWLFNVGIGTICHQRRRPPLHAAVIEIDGRAVLLAGNSGNGKSTTTWAMLRRGHRLLSDDLAVIDPDDMRVWPAFPSVKLWTSAQRTLTPWTSAPSFDPALRVLPDKDKFFLPVPDRFRADPLPLGVIIGLERDETVARPTAHRVPPPLAAAQLQSHVWGRRSGVILDGARTAFAHTSALARSVPYFVLRRPDDLDGVDALCDAIESLAGAAPGRSAGGTVA